MNNDLLEFADFIGRLLAEEWYEIHQKQQEADAGAPQVTGKSAQDARRTCCELDAPGNEEADRSDR